MNGGRGDSRLPRVYKKDYLVKPLGVTVSPPIRFAVAKLKLGNFVDSGFDHLSVTPHLETLGLLTWTGS
jgi:hypothetical protein